MSLLDQTKAFDRVQLQDMIHSLYDRNMPVDIIKTVKVTYKNNKVITMLNEPPAVKIDHGRNYKVKTKQRYMMRTNVWKIICYADDARVMTENENHLQKILHQFHTTAPQHNMIISIENCSNFKRASSLQISN